MVMNERTTLLPNDDGLHKPETTSDLPFPSMRTLFRQGAIINNTGSTARDHLANERTFLAWLRTGLSLIGISLGLLKWSAVSDASGYLVFLLGVSVLITSTQRYFRVMRLLEQGEFEPNIHGILTVVIVSVVAIVAALILHLQHQL